MQTLNITVQVMEANNSLLPFNKTSFLKFRSKIYRWVFERGERNIIQCLCSARIWHWGLQSVSGCDHLPAVAVTSQCARRFDVSWFLGNLKILVHDRKQVLVIRRNNRSVSYCVIIVVHRSYEGCESGDDDRSGSNCVCVCVCVYATCLPPPLPTTSPLSPFVS